MDATDVRENRKMSLMPSTLPAGKAEYNWDEAASMLGISASELQALVVERLGDSDSSDSSLAKMRFRPADLIMLNMMHLGLQPAESAD